MQKSSCDAKTRPMLVRLAPSMSRHTLHGRTLRHFGNTPKRRRAQGACAEVVKRLLNGPGRSPRRFKDFLHPILVANNDDHATTGNVYPNYAGSFVSQDCYLMRATIG